MSSLWHVIQLASRSPFRCVLYRSSRIRSIDLDRAIRGYPTIRCLSYVAPAAVQRVKVAEDKKTLSLLFEGGEEHTYHAAWLKHMCRYIAVASYVYGGVSARIYVKIEVRQNAILIGRAACERQIRIAA